MGYSTDSNVTMAAFALSGRLFVAKLERATPWSVLEIAVAGPVFDPRLDPTGRTVAYASGGALRIVDVTVGVVDNRVDHQ